MSEDEFNNIKSELEQGNLALIEPQPRWRSWALWVSTLGALWTIANAFGLPQKWGIEEGTFKTVVDSIGVILVGFGLLNSPKDKANF